ncbi:30S ribosomal protein S1 [Holosporaceae bacterium 'Namur']|nr:30S ribosomal protein S1 [Holosporaceae bacterium 'Namur']
MAIKSNINKNEEINFTESFAQLFEDSIQNEKKEGTVIKGQVVGIERDAVLIDVGLKSEGRVPLKEFALDGEEPIINIGDTVDVFVERLEGKSGRTVLSREKALREEAWVKFEELQNKDVNVDGKVIGRVKGGFAVDLGGLIAFLPGSQVDIRPVKDASVLMNISQPFKILKMDRDQGNVVVSRRAILEESRAEARNELLSNISEGSILEGVVKNITDYGAFIDLGSLDGLLHITDISWNKISHPSEVLSLGQQIKVMVIKYNPETKRVSLGLKQLESNPWDGLSDKYQPGMRFTGSVTTVTDYGAFVELAQGVEGLVYHTEISWNAKNIHPRKLLKAGDEIEVVVLEIDISKHRISLSMKQCKPNPWQKFTDENPIGTIVEGVVKNIADFGLFVTVNEENPDAAIDALVPAVELTWSDNPEEELKNYKKGDIVKGIVLTSDVERERVTLGIKQLSTDHFTEAADKLDRNSIVTCTVTDVKSDGIEVEVSENIKAFIKKGDISKHKAEQRPERFAVGDRVDAMVVAVDKNTRKVNISIKALEADQEKKAIAEYGSTDSGASLGDILGAALGQSQNKDKE